MPKRHWPPQVVSDNTERNSRRERALLAAEHMLKDRVGVEHCLDIIELLQMANRVNKNLMADEDLQHVITHVLLGFWHLED